MAVSNTPLNRQKEILKYIENNESANTAELSAHFNVSVSTVRRDLEDLKNAGLIDRTHGGAYRLDSSTAYEMARQEKMNIMAQEKKSIAKKAVEYIRDGDTLYLDTGTTTYFVATELKRFKNLTVITSDLTISCMVELDPTSSLIVTGGVRRYEYGTLVGVPADNFLRDIRINTCILGADALGLNGEITNAHLGEANLKKIAIQNSNFRILVTDHTKISKRSLALVGNTAEFDVVIIDNGIGEDNAAKLAEYCNNLVLV